ncbi:hypothetical protein GGF44_005908 [Coemansia sp. RSA 1694]|nr:hypothetical protein GGF38_005375 [Coemansia sp. RSA 25]KAJ2574836.1 hypothetical protein GGH95_003847 [Coemansia sp. RSA 1836]KAJ2616316.1 hypothetical protein GGF44_005908 [Coemansia sp. RSA 1694]
MHCPRNPAMLSKCICDPGRSYTYRSACQTRFAKVNNMAKARMLELIHNSEAEYRLAEKSDDIDGVAAAKDGSK